MNLSFYRPSGTGKGDFFMYDIGETGNRIRKLRKREGKTQEQVAEDMGIGIKTYRSIEQGKRGGSIDTILLLAEYYGISIDFLINGTEMVSDLDRLLLRLRKTKQEKLLRIVKDLVRTLEW